MRSLPKHLSLLEDFLPPGAWVHHTPISLSNSKDLFQDTIEGPEKNDDLQGSSHDNYLETKYYTVKQSGTLSKSH